MLQITKPKHHITTVHLNKPSNFNCIVCFFDTVRQHSISVSRMLQLVHLFGFIYFVAWSSTFWPQALLNHRRQCTTGLSHDFVVMAWIGFVAYTTFTVGGYLSPTVQAAYIRERGEPPPIELADVCFVLHAIVLSSVMLFQVMRLPPKLNARRFVIVGSALTVLFVAAAVAAASFGYISWVTALDFCGSIKVVTSVLKHMPQVWVNFKRKSTIGFSITMILLDIVGGTFSFAQQGLRCIIEGNLTPLTGNMSKFTLAVESILFDFFFCYQHYVLYRNRVDRDVDYTAVGQMTNGENTGIVHMNGV